MIHNSDYGETSGSEGRTGQGLTILTNKDKKEMNTIISTARTMKRIEEGTIPKEDLEICLEMNSKGIGYTADELRTAAVRELNRQYMEEEKIITDTNSGNPPDISSETEISPI